MTTREIVFSSNQITRTTAMALHVIQMYLTGNRRRMRSAQYDLLSAVNL